MVYTVTKTFNGYPCAHRQWAHKDGCQFVHGYQRSFTIVFGCYELDKDTNFVIDFGDLDWIKNFLKENFDHTLLISERDPLIDSFIELNDKGGCNLRILPNPGMEGSAKYVYDFITEYLRETYNKKVNREIWPISVECRENEKNSASYIALTPSEYYGNRTWT